MEHKDWLEIQNLVKEAEGALLSGTLNDWQHANTTIFHVLGTALFDLYQRMGTYPPSDQPNLDGSVLEIDI